MGININITEIIDNIIQSIIPASNLNQKPAYVLFFDNFLYSFFFIKIMQRINAINVGLNKINTIAICQNPILIKIKIILFDIKNLLLYISDN